MRLIDPETRHNHNNVLLSLPWHLERYYIRFSSALLMAL